MTIATSETAARSDLRPSRRESHLVVCIPCLNEEETVARVVDAVPRTVAGVDRIDVLVIDDGSTDRTVEVAERAGAIVRRHGANLGLGRAFRTAIRVALELGADVVVNIDGDGQFDAADIPAIAGPVLRGEAEMATGSRFLRSDFVPEMPTIKRWGNLWVTWIVRLLTGKRFRDVSCGFRAFSREALLRMNLFGSFTYTQETFLDLVFKEMSIVEIPVRVRGVREFGASRVASSIPRYAWRSLEIMLRAFIGYRPFVFFSTLAAAFFAVGIPLLVFLLVHYLRSGGFSPHIWAGFVGGSFCFLGISTLVTGIVGDMLVRMRLNQEQILYRQKAERLDRKRE